MTVFTQVLSSAMDGDSTAPWQPFPMLDHSYNEQMYLFLHVEFLLIQFILIDSFLVS